MLKVFFGAHVGWPIDPPSGSVSYEDVYDRRHERDPVAKREISGLQTPQLTCRVSVEEFEVDVASHG